MCKGGKCMMLQRRYFFIFISVFFGVLQGHVTWQGPETLYIGFPGVSAERYAFLGKYSTNFIAYSGEWISTKSMDILDPRKTYVIKFSEIIDPRLCWWFDRWMNGFFRQKVWERQVGAQFMTSASITGYSVTSYGVDRKQVNMGQAADISAIERQMNWIWMCLYPFDFSKVVWIAYSRGVMAALRYLGKYYYLDKGLPDALILEGGVDTVPHFLCHMFDTHIPLWIQQKQKPQYMIDMLLWGFKKFYAPQYEDEWTGHIFQCISLIPADIPVLLVASRGDELVSYRSVVKMYRAFKDARKGKKGNGDNVHLLILHKARHSYYVDGVNNPLDRDCYQACVHAFYKEYGLPYDEKLAAQGKEIFDVTNKIDEALLLAGSCCTMCNADDKIVSIFKG